MPREQDITLEADMPTLMEAAKRNVQNPLGMTLPREMARQGFGWQRQLFDQMMKSRKHSVQARPQGGMAGLLRYLL